jgi:hypothetical protein
MRVHVVDNVCVILEHRVTLTILVVTSFIYWGRNGMDVAQYNWDHRPDLQVGTTVPYVLYAQDVCTNTRTHTHTHTHTHTFTHAILCTRKTNYLVETVAT